MPVLLVGLKKDLRSHPGAIEEMQRRSTPFVSPQEAEAIARAIGARRYLECSALTGEGVDDVFEVATRASLLINNQPPPSACCVIL